MLLGQPSLANRNKIIEHIGDDADKFVDLFSFLKGAEPRPARMAAWAVSKIADHHSHLIQPYQQELADLLRQPHTHEAVKRNILRVFQGIEIQKDLEGNLMDICFRSLIDKKEPIAIRVFSMQILANLSKKYPEIEMELRLIITDELPYAKPAFVSRGRKTLKQLTQATT